MNHDDNESLDEWRRRNRAEWAQWTPTAQAIAFVAMILAALAVAAFVSLWVAGKAEAAPFDDAPPGCGVPSYVYGDVCNPSSPPVFGRFNHVAETGIPGTWGPDGRYTPCVGRCP